MSEKLLAVSTPEQQPSKLETDLLNAENIIDNFGVERQIFNLNQDLSLIFRGLEEMPDLKSVVNHYNQVRLLATEDKPVFTSQKNYLNQYQKLQSPNSCANNELLVTPATPLGLVEAAQILTERGFGKNNLPYLNQLGNKLKNKVVDEEVRQLYDLMFTSTSIQLENESRQQSLLEATLYLAGNTEAENIINSKKQQRQMRDNYNWLETYGGSPSRRITPDQLNWLRQQNLIAVHTTQTEPKGRILPTAAYSRKSDQHIPRVTIHTSLNHPVESHLWGDFKNRSYTVVTPLAELVSENGLPDNIKSVDTYFTADPNEGLRLPTQTIIITQQQNQELPIIIEDNQVNLRLGPLAVADINDLGVSSEHFRPIDDYYGKEWQRNERKEEIIQHLSKHLFTSFRNNFIDAGHGREYNEEIPCSLELTEAEKDQFNQLATEARQSGITEIDRLSDHSLEEMTSKLLNYYLSLETAQAIDYPHLTEVCQEAVRTLVVKWAISSFGGRVVEAGPHYSYDEKLEEVIQDISGRLKIDNTLHQETDDYFFLAEALENRQLLFHSDYAPTESPKVNTEPSYEFLRQHHDKRENIERLWRLLENLSPEHRRIAVSESYLLYTKPPEEPPAPPGQLLI